MAKEILEQLFDSPVKVKLLKLFLRNPERFFELKEIISRAKTDKPSSRRQIVKLESIKLITSKLKNKKKLYSINPKFDFYKELKTLVLKSSPASKKKILKRLKTLTASASFQRYSVKINHSRESGSCIGKNIKTASSRQYAGTSW